jgi:hypothetical protein
MNNLAGRLLCAFVVFSATLQTSWAQTAAPQPADNSLESPDYSEGTEQNPNTAADETSRPDPASAIPPTGPIRSYFSSGIHVSQGIDSNPGDLFVGSSHIAAVTDVYGSANLLWVGRSSQTALDYLAGSTVYEGSRQPGAFDNQRTQVVDFEQRFFGRKTQLTVRDSLRDLREAGLGSTPLTATGAYILHFTQSAATESTAPAASNFLGVQQPGQPDQQSSLMNLVSIDVMRFLTRRSSSFVTGGYSFTDYVGDRQGLLNDHQFSTQAGYNYQLDRKEQVGFVYGFQSIRFPQAGAGNIETNSVQLLYTRRFFDRMTFSVGGGPEFAVVQSQSAGSQQQLNTTAQAEISYRLRKTNLGLSYSRLVTAGNGIFAGANNNTVHFFVDRRIFRSWQASLTGGYSTVSSISHSLAIPTNIQANSYQYAFIGAVVQRPLGQHLTAFVSYQFDNQNISNLICGSSTVCRPGLQQRHMAAIGFDWNMRPMRLQ